MLASTQPEHVWLLQPVRVQTLLPNRPSLYALQKTVLRFPGNLTCFQPQGGREAGEPREQPRGSSWRGPGQICLGEDGFAGPGGAPGSGEGRLLRQRKLGQSRQWRAGVLQIADGEGRRKRLRPSRKLCLLRLWGQLPAHSRCGSRWHTVHQANSATFASFSQHDLVGRPFRRSSLGQGEAEGDDGEGRRKGRGLAPRCPVGCLGAAPGSFSFSWIAG